MRSFGVGTSHDPRYAPRTGPGSPRSGSSAFVRAHGGGAIAPNPRGAVSPLTWDGRFVLGADERSRKYVSLPADPQVLLVAVRPSWARSADVAAEPPVRVEFAL